MPRWVRFGVTLLGRLVHSPSRSRDSSPRHSPDISPMRLNNTVKAVSLPPSVPSLHMHFTFKDATPSNGAKKSDNKPFLRLQEPPPRAVSPILVDAIRSLIDVDAYSSVYFYVHLKYFLLTVQVSVGAPASTDSTSTSTFGSHNSSGDPSPLSSRSSSNLTSPRDILSPRSKNLQKELALDLSLAYGETDKSAPPSSRSRKKHHSRNNSNTSNPGDVKLRKTPRGMKSSQSSIKFDAVEREGGHRRLRSEVDEMPLSPRRGERVKLELDMTRADHDRAGGEIISPRRAKLALEEIFSARGNSPVQGSKGSGGSVAIRPEPIYVSPLSEIALMSTEFVETSPSHKLSLPPDLVFAAKHTHMRSPSPASSPAPGSPSSPSSVCIVFFQNFLLIIRAG